MSMRWRCLFGLDSHCDLFRGFKVFQVCSTIASPFHFLWIVVMKDVAMPIAINRSATTLQPSYQKTDIDEGERAERREDNDGNEGREESQRPLRGYNLRTLEDDGILMEYTRTRSLPTHG